MNFSELAENLSLEEDEFLELVELFVKTSAADLERLQSAIVRGSIQQVVEAAHSVKGAAVHLGFTEIYDLSKAIEEKARQNTIEGASKALEAIRDKFDQIAEALRTQ